MTIIITIYEKIYNLSEGHQKNEQISMLLPQDLQKLS